MAGASNDGGSGFMSTVCNHKPEHVHDWQYNEAKEVIRNRQKEWISVRFCKKCLKVEAAKLNEND